MGTELQITSCSPPKQIKHSSPLQRHVLLPLIYRISKSHIFSPFLLWLTEGTKSYKVLPRKHKDDQRGTNNSYTSMNVKKQDPMDIEETTYAKYEWHTYEMQTNKTPPMKSKGCKNNSPIKKIVRENILRRRKNEIAHRIPIFSLSFYAKHYVTKVQMYVTTSKHDHLRLYNIVLNEIKMQACKVFSTQLSK